MSDTRFVTTPSDHHASADDLPMLTTKELEADPHDVLRTYRMSHSVVKHEVGGYVVLRFADVERLSRDPRFLASGTASPEIRGIREGALFDTFEHGMLTANGEVHRRRRSPFSRAFAHRIISLLRSSIRREADELVDEWYGGGSTELVEYFASQLPARIISDLLGLPREDVPAFTKLVYEVTRFFNLAVADDEIPHIEAATRQLQVYVENTLDDRRREPGEDFLSTFLAAADAAGEMSPIEIIIQILLLIIAGTDTTRVAMVMQVALLLQHSEQWTTLVRNPDLVPAAVAEAMRFEPSVASYTRIASQDIEVGGVVLPEGAYVTLSTMSAMRDKTVYDDPDVFDIGRIRRPRIHPIFGGGAHRCLGEALAVAELEESLAVLTQRIPELRLDQAPEIIGASGIRRVSAMQVSWPV
jgi:cytochrome P450 family 103